MKVRYLLDTGMMGHFINHRRSVDVRVREANQRGARIGTCMPVVGEWFYVVATRARLTISLESVIGRGNGRSCHVNTKRRIVRSPMTNGLLPEEDSDIRQDIATVIADAERWLDMPNDQLGGAKPRDLIGTHREQIVRDLVRAIKHGMPT
jgi:hypothetical protein